MPIAKLLFCFAVLIASSCSSVEKREAVKADHETNKNIPEIDEMLVKHKREYIERCYMPVFKRTPSNSPRPCETELQQALERRYSMNFTQEQVDMVADELFFKGMRERIEKKMRAEPNFRRTVSRKFRTIDKMMDYYQSKYTFRQIGN